MTPTGDTPPPSVGLRLSPKQRGLHRALLEQSPKAADLYFSALLVLNQEDIPCSYIMAGHAIREMVNELPKFLAIPQPDKPANIKVKVNALKTVWEKCKVSKPEPWDRSVDDPLEKFIKQAKEFFTWYAEEHAVRYERNAALVRGLDPSANKLPQQLEQIRVKEWEDHYHYFAGVAHLRDSAKFNQAKFDQWFEALQDNLLSALVPRTFDDFEEIDAILQEGEI